MSKKFSSRVRNGSGTFNKWLFSAQFWKNAILTVIIGFLFITGAVMLWVASLRIPDLSSFEEKVLAGSTRIYDKTGEILLYDLNQDVKRQVVPFAEIPEYAKQATLAIEDEDFYEHKGIAITSIIRAVIVDIQHMSLSQGGSTITQQVIKNSLLTTDKKFSRKIKEWVLALKLERVMSKDDILNLYLNSTPYGRTYYGIEVASQGFFGKSSKDVSLAEAAYLAAIPQSPSYYLNHREDLDARKNLVLTKMKELGYITDAQYQSARAEKVTFISQTNNSIKAPHFVMYIKDYLEEKYGEDEVRNGNLRVITTLDYELQQKAEEIVKKYALENEKKFNAENAALVAIDPTTGHILSMVGSRDYFDEDIQGSFNVTTAHRQPGSAFKPFAYVTAFNKGYTPDTVLFDLPTQFSTACDADGIPLPGRTVEDCYMPNNYDLQFMGPMTVRNALAQSRNIPAIKALYLAGMNDTIKTARDMGITSLNRGINEYGLTLVLGGGEVSPLEITSAYSVFANNGLKNPHTGILKITDKKGNTIEEYKQNAEQVLPEQSALLMNSILSDNNARLPLNGAGTPTDFPGMEVALKTGTTNDYRDTWVVGYTPNIAVGTWAGNNDNSAMQKKTSGLIMAPLWRAFMDEALKKYPPTAFKRPEPYDPNLKPILRGAWQGGQTYVVDKTTGLLATEFTPPENREERSTGGNIHTILYWVDKNDPKGPQPSNPAADSQFNLWEKPIQAWASARGGEFQSQIPTQYSDANNPDAAPKIRIATPIHTSNYGRAEKIVVSITHENRFPLTRAEYYINDTLVGSGVGENPTFSFVPQEIPNIQQSNTLKVVVYDNANNKGEDRIQFNIR